ncbi:hypothetical protein [uncultured Paracoccus sp.]|uniref:hypothetical protein n=1 Tax=uncultured Paracoccus sp. TaxID=189685 RepID=UPI00260FF3EF|nr:hypothetical protein [uncultured Paracoccus sp.]
MAGPARWSSDLDDNIRRYGAESEEAARNTLPYYVRIYERSKQREDLDALNGRLRLLGLPDYSPEQLGQPHQPQGMPPGDPAQQPAKPATGTTAPNHFVPRAEPPRTAGFAAPSLEENGVLPPPPADLGKVDRNLSKLVSRKAPDSDIEAYLNAEGVTLDQVMKYKTERQNMSVGGRIVSDVAEFAGSLPRNLYNYVIGEEDPRNRSLSDVWRTPVGNEKGEARYLFDATDELAGLTDDQALDIAKKRLGNSFIGVENDSRGRPIIQFRGADGKTERAYINKPGLDAADVNRAIGGAVPYLASATLAGRLGGGAVTQAGLQGVAAGSTSIGQDKAAQAKGSDRGVDFWRAGFAAGGAGVGQLVGSAVYPMLRQWVKSRELVDDAGKLTARGRQMAQREGIDPDDVDAELAAYIARQTGTAKDQAEGMVSAQTGYFGIPTTKGQRTKDPQALLTEKDARYGTLGNEAKDVMQQFDRDQTQAISRAVIGDPSGAAGSQRSIAPMIAPNRTPTEIGRDQIGQGIRGGLETARAGARTVEEEAWGKVGPLMPTPEAVQTLPQFLLKALGTRKIDPKVTPNAASMLDDLEAMFKGQDMRPGYDVLAGQPGRMSVDEVRRRLGPLVNAKDPADRAAAKAVYGAFNDWIDDAAEKSLLRGDPASAMALRAARAASRDVKGLFEPRTTQGMKAPAAKILERMAAADSGEGVVRAMFGAGGPKATPAEGVVDAVKNYRRIVTKYGGEAGKDAWNDVRLAYFLRLTMDGKGQVQTPGNLANSLEQAFASHETLMRTLYTPREFGQIKLLAKAVREATYKDPNPSGSGVATRALFPQLVQQALQTQSKRELFSKHNVIMSRIYSALAKAVPNIAGGKDYVGGKVARRMTSQAVTPARPPVAGGAYGGVSGYATQDQSNNVPLNSLIDPAYLR